jgi:hypothetical protein
VHDEDGSAASGTEEGSGNESSEEGEVVSRKSCCRK